MTTFKSVYEIKICIVFKKTKTNTKNKNSLKREMNLKMTLNPWVSQPSSFSISCLTDKITGPSFSSSQMKFRCS